jgi:hypothetical protein
MIKASHNRGAFFCPYDFRDLWQGAVTLNSREGPVSEIPHLYDSVICMNVPELPGDTIKSRADHELSFNSLTVQTETPGSNVRRGEF